MPRHTSITDDGKPAADVLACAAAVEARLEKAGMQLTMGGEPTFVPLQPSGVEWSVAALGPTKLDYARRFAGVMLRRVPAGAVILETSGKHYPGEPIPRWCLQIQWRTDGLPLWRNSALLRTDDVATGPCSRHDAERLAHTLAARLRLKRFVRSVVEPAGAKPGFEGGYVLPLDHVEGKWISDRWPILRGRNTLFYGDSWAGLRLPMSKLPEKTLRRALAVEARNGWLVVFVPPLLFDAYAELLARIEEIVTKLGCGPITLAGYLPPGDPRFATLGLAADPGVIEANLTPAATWTGYRENVLRVCQAAEETGLRMCKYHFNGRATGTGGASHLCFGGPAAAVSPFLTRPVFLPSILRFWQRHPVLSYLFSGQYVGPGSQAPRVDECVPEALSQLELACRGAEKFGDPSNWNLYQLLFRDLLTDRGGNTHRAEISIDKLWNLTSPNGTLGLIEFRAFETHPDPEVLAVTGLFVRAILAHLAGQSANPALIDWRGALNDRFFLPTLLWEQFAVIAARLRRARLPFNEAWLRPVWEFRFPVVGRLPTPQGEVVVRQALESWPLLSEFSEHAATARAVDSSLDRLEVSVPAAASKSGALLVNGIRVPLRRAGGVALAGIRYRAFHLVPGMHPHIGAQGPLRFEWIDASTGAVSAAARYHPWHPLGDPYPSLPQNAAEAAKRVAERWEKIPAGWSGGTKLPSAPRVRGFTLDLRHCATAESQA